MDGRSYASGYCQPGWPYPAGSGQSYGEAPLDTDTMRPYPMTYSNPVMPLAPVLLPLARGTADVAHYGTVTPYGAHGYGYPMGTFPPGADGPEAYDASWYQRFYKGYEGEHGDDALAVYGDAPVAEDDGDAGVEEEDDDGEAAEYGYEEEEEEEEEAEGWHQNGHGTGEAGLAEVSLAGVFPNDGVGDDGAGGGYDWSESAGAAGSQTAPTVLMTVAIPAKTGSHRLNSLAPTFLNPGAKTFVPLAKAAAPVPAATAAAAASDAKHASAVSPVQVIARPSLGSDAEAGGGGGGTKGVEGAPGPGQGQPEADERSSPAEAAAPASAPAPASTPGTAPAPVGDIKVERRGGAAAAGLNSADDAAAAAAAAAVAPHSQLAAAAESPPAEPLPLPLTSPPSASCNGAAVAVVLTEQPKTAAPKVAAGTKSGGCCLPTPAPTKAPSARSCSPQGAADADGGVDERPLRRLSTQEFLQAAEAAAAGTAAGREAAAAARQAARGGSAGGAAAAAAVVGARRRGAEAAGATVRGSAMVATTAAALHDGEGPLAEQEGPASPLTISDLKPISTPVRCFVTGLFSLFQGARGEYGMDSLWWCLDILNDGDPSAAGDGNTTGHGRGAATTSTALPSLLSLSSPLPSSSSTSAWASSPSAAAQQQQQESQQQERHERPLQPKQQPSVHRVLGPYSCEQMILACIAQALPPSLLVCGTRGTSPPHSLPPVNAFRPLGTLLDAAEAEQPYQLLLLPPPPPQP